MPRASRSTVMAEHVHIVTGDAHWLQHRDVLRTIASAVTHDHDISAEKSMAQTYDEIFSGGDDRAVGNIMTTVINTRRGTDSDYCERVTLTIDLIRTARRTKH